MLDIEDIKISGREMLVLMALQENPLATYKELSKMTGLAKSVVFLLVKDLSNEIKDQRPPYFKVHANPNLFNLGLEVVDVIVSAKSNEQMEFIEKICKLHPYTIYHAPCFGKINGMMIQFRIPYGSSNKIKELFNKLQEKKNINSFEIFPPSQTALYTTSKIKNWDPSSFTWKFSWRDWFLKNSLKINEQESSLNLKEEMGSSKKWLQKRDIAVFGELVNARQKKVDMIKNLKNKNHFFNPQTFSRRFKRIKEECILNYRVFLNPHCFKLMSSIFVWGSADEEILKNLRLKVKKVTIPFNSTFKLLENKIFWYLQLPPNHLSEFLIEIRKIIPEINFYYIDYFNSLTFSPWPQTFNEEKSDWKIGNKFMIDDVIKNLN